jgi:hypothetical protein
MLHNFGGRMGMFGDLPTISKEPPDNYKSKSQMIGIGTTMEAYSNSGIMYDLISDMTWEDEPISYMEYINGYVQSRYGSLDASAVEGWAIIANTALARKTSVVQGPPESVINARPSLTFTSASTWGHSNYMYDKQALEEALPHFIRAYDTLGSNPAFVYDFVELTAQVLSTATLEYHRQMVSAYQARNLDNYNSRSAKFLEAIELMERVLSVSQDFGVGKWIDRARNMLPDMDDWSRDLFEFNARALITTWGAQKNPDLKDYSNRQWSGLTKGLYLQRWTRFVAAYRDALANGTQPVSVNYFLIEWEWANRKSDEGFGYPLSGSGEDLKQLAQSVYDGYSLKSINNN